MLLSTPENILCFLMRRGATKNLEASPKGLLKSSTRQCILSGGQESVRFIYGRICVSLVLDVTYLENYGYCNISLGLPVSPPQVFFTRNGKIIGKKESILPQGGFYPTIGMLSSGEKVKVDLHPLSG